MHPDQLARMKQLIKITKETSPPKVKPSLKEDKKK
tara:strand:- start:307 stop:411 length:105 start_codon:yes stop_codon:yes gene_type:complete